MKEEKYSVDVDDIPMTKERCIPVHEHLKNHVEYYEEEKGMGIEEYAKAIGYPYHNLVEVLQGNLHITPELALKIEKYDGTPASTWGALAWGYEIDKELIRTKTCRNDWRLNKNK